ncbi:hypothetical protein K470DRAFT_276668 [Piedraia hortae CBS 480.64]|uniref:NADH-ubiquinone oxidoreductase 17.8 kDa subunit n=1 Tax=Piedraia hortae CBS 480.64 TaxID=1314780 RepID=A0A6A7BZT9_9PEZI|nr:hypothetical protein K470DRAFT_276668 [Piedraia hortae CBS 480.64]
MRPLIKAPIARSICQSLLKLRITARSYTAEARSSTGDAHGNESLGRSFYIVLLLIPGAIGFYKFRHSDEANPITRYIAQTYETWGKKWNEQQSLYTEMLDRAGSDRVLFLNEPTAFRNTKAVRVRFPEQITAGAAWNVPAGHYANVDKVIEKYRDEAYVGNEEKLKNLRDNRIKGEMPFEKSGLPRNQEV